MDLKDLVYDNISETKTNGITQKRVSIIKKGKKMITLAEVKEICKELDKKAKQTDAKYIVLGRNDLRDHTTIRSGDGRFVDEIDNYYENQGFDKDTFEKFYRIEIIMTAD